MRTAPDCFPCLLNQALATARRAELDTTTTGAVLRHTCRLLAQCDPFLAPPQHAAGIYRYIRERAGGDPFAAAKAEANRVAEELAATASQKIDASADPRYTALRYAIGANLIDLGAPHGKEPAAAISACLDQPLAVDHYQELAADLDRARTVLYLADNCGEIVFDRLVLERLGGQEKWLMVRGAPVLNDATAADAREVGLHRVTTVVANGTDIPGTVPAQLAPEAARLLEEADVVISKGQGNFETLADIHRRIYFLFTVKCAVVAGHLSHRLGRTMRIGEGTLFNC